MKLKLSKGLSYSGNGISATNKKPYVNCTDEIGKKLLATGYFKEEAEETAASDEKSSDNGTGSDTATKKKSNKKSKESSEENTEQIPDALDI